MPYKAFHHKGWLARDKDRLPAGVHPSRFFDYRNDTGEKGFNVKYSKEQENSHERA